MMLPLGALVATEGIAIRRAAAAVRRKKRETGMMGLQRELGAFHLFARCAPLHTALRSAGERPPDRVLPTGDEPRPKLGFHVGNEPVASGPGTAEFLDARPDAGRE